ncbi:MAG: glycosyltransferase family 9 protein, partial [Nitrospinae bacterium]|nr:glycosyltransferase family 9 protein [Nitrospinota bacterium]
MVVKKILILNMTRMGDLIQSTPVIAGLRRQYPQAHITLVVTSDFAEFSERIPDIDDRRAFNLRQFEDKKKLKGIMWIELYRYLESFMEELKSGDYDLLINLSHSRFSAFIISYLGIKNLRGFACNETGDRITLDPWMQYFGTEPFNRMYNPFNLVEIFTRSVGAAPEEHPIHIQSIPEDAEAVAEILTREKIEPGDFIIGIQAGSSLKGRRWPASAFAELADGLMERLGAKIILFGVASESGLAGEIRSCVRQEDRVIDLTGKTNISQLLELVKRCSYLVTNDTGTMHIAAAVGTPIVGLFFAHAHPFETGPYSPGHLIFQARIPCSPCGYGVECNNIVCVRKVRPQHLLSMIEIHRKESLWRLPASMGSLEEVNIFQTCIGEDRRLRLQPLVRHPLTSIDLFRECYTHLWLDVLGTVPIPGAGSRGIGDRLHIGDRLREDYDCSNVDELLLHIQEKLGALKELEKLARQGMRRAEEIVRLCSSRKPGGRTARLQVLAARVDSLDDEINQTGCTHPEVKPISDMFSKRKENLQGEDTVRLARETRVCYQ